MKKLILALCLLLMVSVGAAGEEVQTETAPTVAEIALTMRPESEEPTHLTVGNSTKVSGSFFTTQFGNNNAYCQDNIISWLDWTRLEKYREIHDFVRYMIGFRKRYAILRKKTKPVACNLPEISIHNGYPWNGGTDSNSRLIGIMYAGRDEHDTRDDIVFYCMNAYWETLVMQLPELPNGLQWKVCVNTSVEYEDGKDMESYTEFYYKKTLKVPPRTAIVLVAE